MGSVNAAQKAADKQAAKAAAEALEQGKKDTQAADCPESPSVILEQLGPPFSPFPFPFLGTAGMGTATARAGAEGAGAVATAEVCREDDVREVRGSPG